MELTSHSSKAGRAAIYRLHNALLYIESAHFKGDLDDSTDFAALADVERLSRFVYSAGEISSENYSSY
jgi:hypothetical protein